MEELSRVICSLRIFLFSILIISVQVYADEFDEYSFNYFDSTQETVSGGQTSSSIIYPILRVTSDAMPGMGELRLVLDSNKNIESLYYLSHKGEKKPIPIAQLPHGVALLHLDGHDIVKIKSQNPSTQYGGSVDIVYLSNGIFGSYDTFNMELVRRGDQWILQTNDQSGRREFKNIFFKAKKIFGKAIGIEEIEVS